MHTCPLQTFSEKYRKQRALSSKGKGNTFPKKCVRKIKIFQVKKNLPDVKENLKHSVLETKTEGRDTKNDRSQEIILSCQSSDKEMKDKFLNIEK